MLPHADDRAPAAGAGIALARAIRSDFDFGHFGHSAA
jgi:hypothetical protein